MSPAFAFVEAVGILTLVTAVALDAGLAAEATWRDLTITLTSGAFLAAVCLVGFYYAGLYDPRRVTSGRALVGHLARWTAVAVGITALVWLALPAAWASVWSLTWMLALMLTVLVPLRACWLALVQARSLRQRVVVLGTGSLAHAILAAMPPSEGAIGIVSDGADAPAPRRRPFRHPRLGSLTSLDVILERVRPHRVIVAVTERRERLAMQRLLESRVRGVVVEDGVEVYERLSGKLAIETLSPSELLFCRGFRASPLHRVGARLVSMLVAGAGLVLSAPLMGLIALAVRRDSPGPVLFVHRRVGLNAQPFNLLKFRTMRDVDHGTTEWVRDNTDRITRVGAWLRKFRLDELPQFINILRGDMNLVGPRPHPVSNFELFAETIPYYSLRALVRPGVTGWAQVRYGYANCLEEETEKMRYDLYYIKHRSLLFDLRILFDTVKVVVLGLGATKTHTRSEADDAVSRLPAKRANAV